MDAKTIKEKISSFPAWHYEFEIAGIKTPITQKYRVNAHSQRRRYFFDPLVELCGGSLKDKRVLDLGCNAGYWSLAAMEHDCDYVFGIDGRQMHVDQANFVFEASGFDKSRYDFVQGNLFEYDFGTLGTFDIVLCLGLMYHVSEPVGLMETIAGMNDDICVIDTALSVAPGSYLRIRSESLDSRLNAADRELVVSPTKKAVLDMARAFGYSVVVLKPRFTDYEGAKKYREGRRKAFICAKKTSLSKISAPLEQVGSRPSLAEYAYLAADNAKAVPKKVARKLKGTSR